MQISKFLLLADS